MDMSTFQVLVDMAIFQVHSSGYVDISGTSGLSTFLVLVDMALFQVNSSGYVDIVGTH